MDELLAKFEKIIEAVIEYIDNMDKKLDFILLKDGLVKKNREINVG